MCFGFASIDGNFVPQDRNIFHLTDWLGSRHKLLDYEKE